MAQQSSPRVYSAAGEFLGSIGRDSPSGSTVGLGDFYWPVYLLSAGDSMVVLDPLASAMTVVGPDLDPVRIIRMPGLPSRGIIRAWPTSAILAGAVMSPDGIGWPLHDADLSRPSVSVRTSFGTGDGRVLPSDPPWQQDRVIVADDREGFWAAETRSIVAYRFDADLAHQATLRLDPDQQPDSRLAQQAEVFLWDELYVRDLLLDSDGLLWVFSVARTAAAAGTSRPSNDAEWCTVIAVFDSSDGRLLTLTTHPELFVGVVGPAQIAMKSPGGGPGVSISAIELTR